MTALASLLIYMHVHKRANDQSRASTDTCRKHGMANNHTQTPHTYHTIPHHAPVQAEYEAEKAELEARHRDRLRQLRTTLEEEEAAARRKLTESSDTVLQEYRRQMEVGCVWRWAGALGGVWSGTVRGKGKGWDVLMVLWPRQPS